MFWYAPKSNHPSRWSNSGFHNTQIWEGILQGKKYSSKVPFDYRYSRLYDLGQG
jgi:hypothetical protein